MSKYYDVCYLGSRTAFDFVLFLNKLTNKRAVIADKENLQEGYSGSEDE